MLPPPDEPDSQPRLTVAIPFYRGVHYLEKALHSVLAQTDPNWMMLVCDDRGDEAGAQGVVASLNDPRVRYERNKKNLGMAANWNRCLDLAPTDLVTLLHADDELLPNYVELMRAGARVHTLAVALFCGARVIDSAGQPSFSFTDFVKRFLVPRGRGDVALNGEMGLAALLRGDFIMCPTVCYRRSRLGARRFAPDWRSAHDLEFFARLLLDGEHLIGFRQVGYAYRRHAENALAGYTANLVRFAEERRLYDVIARAANERQWRQAAAIARRKTMLKLHLAYVMFADLGRCRWQRAAEKLTYLWNMVSPSAGEDRAERREDADRNPRL